jgi:hypothetical protein
MKADRPDDGWQKENRLKAGRQAAPKRTHVEAHEVGNLSKLSEPVKPSPVAAPGLRSAP